MANNEETAKKPRKRSYVGIVLLILLLALIGTGGFLYYSAVKAPLVLDNPQQLAASAPMIAKDRFRVLADEQTVQMKIDAADIWSLILDNAGNDFMDIINKELSSYDLSVSGCAIHMDEDGLRLDLEIFYQEHRLIAKIPCTLEVSGQHFCLKPAGVKLGVIPLPIEKLVSSVKFEYDFPLPVISDVTGVSYEQNAILITGTMEEDVRSLLPADQTLFRLAVFCESMQPLVDSLKTEAGFKEILTHLEQHPEDIEKLYNDLFTIADSEITEAYLDSRMGLTQRFFPGIDFSDLEAARTELSEEVEPLNAILERFFSSVVSDYNGKVFHLSDGEFLKKLEPFHATNYGSGLYDTMFEVLDPDSFFLILVDVEDGFIRNTSSFYRICDENQQFTQSVDFNKTYILGCVFRSLDGEPFLLYETETHIDSTYYRNLTLQPLTEDEVSALQVPGKFGVWTG